MLYGTYVHLTAKWSGSWSSACTLPRGTAIARPQDHSQSLSAWRSDEKLVHEPALAFMLQVRAGRLVLTLCIQNICGLRRTNHRAETLRI